MQQEPAGSLEIDQDLEFQRRGWVAQRIGWAVMVVLIVFALLGLFATGPLSNASAGDEGGPLYVEYSRFARHDARMTLDIFVGPEAVRAGEVAVWIDSDIVGSNRIAAISPEPDRVDLGTDRLTYTFTVGEITAPARITLHLRADALGMRRGEIGLPDGETVSIRQFVYP
jgi:hypothetical protein